MEELKLLKGWEVVDLKSIADSIQYGYTESSSKDNIGPKFLRITDIQENNVDWEKVPYCKIDEKVKSKYLLKEGDLLFARTGATVGKSFLIKGEIPQSVFASYLIRVRVNLSMNEKYLSYFFQSPEYWGQITEGQIGIGQPNVNGTKLGQLKINMPSKELQNNIVSKIEELFSDIDKGIDDLKLAQQQLRVYRQSVLKWAFEGKLTNENVKDEELPEGWKICQMGEVIEKPKYGTSKKCDYTSKGKGVLRIPNIASGIVDSSDLKFAEFDEKEIEAYSLRERDILTIRSNGSVDLVGKCALIANHDSNFLYAGYLIRLRPLMNKVNPKYLLNILSSSSLRTQIENKAKSTSGVNNINSEELATLRIALPSLEEQEQIVQEIESRVSVADKMEENIVNGLKKAEALKMSVLRRAFRGELV